MRPISESTPLDQMPSISAKHIGARVFVFFVLLPISGCSTLPVESDLDVLPDDPPPVIEIATDIESTPEPQTEDIWQRMRDGFTLSAEVHTAPVIREQNKYLRNPKLLKNFFNRAEPYIFYVVEQLEKAQLPQELALLPIVESAYDPFAYSHSHAVGLWQFMPTTGKSLGLHRDRWYDGRRDVVKSTQAAVRYLKYLNKRFNGDWLHTLAAYNSGEGTVKKAIKSNKRRGKSTDFWSLKLPRETRNYVPRLLALAHIVINPQAHKFELPDTPNAAYFDIVPLTSQIDLNKVIEITGIDETLFINLNSAYRRSVTPPQGDYHILLPQAYSDQLVDFMRHNKPSTWAPYREYIVKSGDTLSHIAQRYQLPTSVIKQYNGLRRDFLKVGQVLQIPPTGEQAETGKLKSLQTINYKVVSGDTLSEIAQKFNTSVANLKRYNGLNNNTIRAGQILSIYTPKSSASPQRLRKLTYRVRRGDSLYLIAKRFNLTIAAIVRWNKLDKDKYLQPGQRLILYINPLKI